MPGEGGSWRPVDYLDFTISRYTNGRNAARAVYLSSRDQRYKREVQVYRKKISHDTEYAVPSIPLELW